MTTKFCVECVHCSSTQYIRGHYCIHPEVNPVRISPVTKHKYYRVDEIKTCRWVRSSEGLCKPEGLLFKKKPWILLNYWLVINTFIFLAVVVAAIILHGSK